MLFKYFDKLSLKGMNCNMVKLEVEGMPQEWPIKNLNVELYKEGTCTDG